MRNIILLVCLFLSLTAISQKPVVKEKMEWLPKRDPKFQNHDTTYYRWDRDTILGNISYQLGNGIVSGKGMIVTTTCWEYHGRTPADTSQRYLVMGKDTIGWSGGSGYIGYINNKNTSAYIKSSFDKWLVINEKYTFNP